MSQNVWPSVHWLYLGACGPSLLVVSLLPPGPCRSPHRTLRQEDYRSHTSDRESGGSRPTAGKTSSPQDSQSYSSHSAYGLFTPFACPWARETAWLITWPAPVI